MPPGVLILSDDNDVVSLTGAAQHWLAQLPADDARGLDLPAVILSAASQARALAAGEPGAAVPAARLRTTAGGWLRLHAARLTAGPGRAGQTAVMLEPARPADLSPLALDLHELTHRERQITQLLLRGLPTKQIAQELFISRYTLGDHIKAIFAKLGVTSRPALTALLLDHAPAGLPGRRYCAAPASCRDDRSQPRAPRGLHKPPGSTAWWKGVPGPGCDDGGWTSFSRFLCQTSTLVLPT
jgi:DNA-binding CsgD family transcriptional regulator